MAKYKPGTLDDEAAFRRRFDETDRIARESARPSGSNVYDTTGKVRELGESALAPISNLELEELLR